MKQFPDTSRMEKSKDGTEPIRGGSIGFNRILGFFEEASRYDRVPRFHSFIISAYTIFRNIWGSTDKRNNGDLDNLFIQDIKLFTEYYDIYLSLVLSNMDRGKKALVLIYFPDYKKLSKDFLTTLSDKQKEFSDAYESFRRRHSLESGVIISLENVIAVIDHVGSVTYPHKELMPKFRDLNRFQNSLYTTRDPFGLISHIPLDFYVCYNARSVLLMESFTAKIRSPEEFRLKLDSDGRLPFLPSVHVTFGDGVMIKGIVHRKEKTSLLEIAKKEKWILMNESSIQKSIIKFLNLSNDYFRKVDFL